MPGTRRAGHGAAEPPWLCAVARLSCVRRNAAVSQLQRHAHRAPVGPRGAVPLLQLRPPAAAVVRLVRRRVPRVHGHRDGACRAGGRHAVSSGTHRASGPRHDDAPGCHREGARALCPARDRRARGHADDRQGARLSAGHTRGRHLGGHRPRRGRLQGRRADVSTADAGGWSCRARRGGRRGAHPDAPSRPLRDRPCQPAGLPGVHGARTGVSRADAIPAVRLDDQRRASSRVAADGDA